MTNWCKILELFSASFPMASASLTSFSLSTPLKLPVILRSSQISPKPPLSFVQFQSKKPSCCIRPLAQAETTSFLASTQNNISRTITGKVITFALGSLIFMGSFGCRWAVAEPIGQEGNLTESVEASEEEEEEMYVKMLEQNPRNVESLKMVVNLKMKNGKTKEAVGYVERLIKVEPNELEWRLLQALCYDMMGQLGTAKRLLKDILKQKPLLLRALHGLAMVMHKNLEGPAVFEMLDRALELARRENKVNEERNIKILTAQMHVVKGEFDEALEKLQALINENPRDFRPYLCQGIVYSLLKKETEASECFEVYRSLVPEEFPQRRFLDDVMLAAKTEPRHKLEKESQS